MTEQELVGSDALMLDCQRADMEVPLKHFPMVTATQEQQSARCGNVVLAQRLLFLQLVECLQTLWDPWHHTLLDSQAALAIELIEIKDMCTEGGARLPRTRSAIPRQGGS